MSSPEFFTTDTSPQLLAILTTVSASLVLLACGRGGSGAMSLPNPSHLSCNTPSTAITHNASNINVAQIVFLNPATYPDAVCNDGTAAAYAIRPGSGAAANRWVILLQGGDNCYDQASCSARAAGKPALISSTPYRSNPDLAPQMDGVQSSSPSTNPDFYDATQVQALYCSSDYWSGAKSGAGTFNPNDDATWNFQGRAILSAVIADLEQNYGLSSASEILLTGESAGGVGVYATVNDVTKLVPATARFVASSDAGFGNIAADFNASGAPPTTPVRRHLSMKPPGRRRWPCGTAMATALAPARRRPWRRNLGAMRRRNCWRQMAPSPCRCW